MTETENTPTAPQGAGCSESPCYAEGDHVEVIDGSEAHGDRGRILYQQKNGIIVVELYSGACWPVEANEIRKLHNDQGVTQRGENQPSQSAQKL